MRLIDASKFDVYMGKQVPPEYDVDSYLAGCLEVLEAIDNAEPITLYDFWVPVKNPDAFRGMQKYDKVLATVRVFDKEGNSHLELRLCYYRSWHWWFDCSTNKPVDVVAFIKLPKVYKENEV